MMQLLSLRVLSHWSVRVAVQRLTKDSRKVLVVVFKRVLGREKAIFTEVTPRSPSLLDQACLNLLCKVLRQICITRPPSISLSNLVYNLSDLFGTCREAVFTNSFCNVIASGFEHWRHQVFVDAHV